MVNRIALHGKRIALLGGADVDILCRLTEDDLRAHVREILCACMPGDGYTLGTWNSVANYVPIRNYLAVLDEGAGTRIPWSLRAAGRGGGMPCHSTAWTGARSTRSG